MADSTMVDTPEADRRTPEASELMALIAAWRARPEVPLCCPLCHTECLAITDKSARPYAEWYAISCRACGWQHNLHIPQAPPPAL